MKKVSLETIAKQLNISVVTVHKALKNQQGVGPELRSKILELADQLGYVRRVSSPKRNYIHILRKDFLIGTDERYYTTIYYYLNRECTNADSKLFFVVHDILSATMAYVKNLMQETHIDGIFLSGQMDSDLLIEIEKLKIPVVCIDFYSSDYNFYYAYIDNYYAGYTLTKYLIRHGHKHIGFVGDIKFSNAVADRYFGCLRALNKFDIPDRVFHLNSNIERFPDSFELNRNNLPTAFICHCDRAASVLYDKLKVLGYRIPEDISVISFDNTEICDILSPKLTSLGIDKAVFAAQAFRLMDLAQQNKSDGINYIKLNLSLCERESVKDITQPSPFEADND